MAIELFRELLIETAGDCNRRCPTCLRQSFPGGHRRAPHRVMPDALVTRLIEEAAAMGFTGRLNLQFFNEPLADPRIPAFARHAKSLGVFSAVQFYSNADYLTRDMAAGLDGAVDIIEFALYDPGPGGTPLSSGMSEREALIRSWFSSTRVRFSGGGHVITHFSPLPGLADAVARARPLPCVYDAQERMIVDSAGDMMMCCDDIVGVFGLGSVLDRTLAELWYGERHQALVEALSRPGGRAAHPYCTTCPRIS